jgi:hypothetical protein
MQFVGVRGLFTARLVMLGLLILFLIGLQLCGLSVAPAAHVGSGGAQGDTSTRGGPRP